MQIIFFLILFVMALFGIPTIWFTVELFIESGTKEFEPLINYVRNIKINGKTIEEHFSLDHDEPNENRLFWDYKTKTMYGHPIMVLEIA